MLYALAKELDTIKKDFAQAEISRQVNVSLYETAVIERDALLGFAKHHSHCTSMLTPIWEGKSSAHCSCGLDAVLDRYGLRLPQGR